MAEEDATIIYRTRM